MESVWSGLIVGICLGMLLGMWIRGQDIPDWREDAGAERSALELYHQGHRDGVAAGREQERIQRRIGRPSIGEPSMAAVEALRATITRVSMTPSAAAVFHRRSDPLPADLPDWDDAGREEQEEATQRPLDLAAFQREVFMVPNPWALDPTPIAAPAQTRGWAYDPDIAAIEADAQLVAVSGGARWEDLAETAQHYPDYARLLHDLASAVREDAARPLGPRVVGPMSALAPYGPLSAW